MGFKDIRKVLIDCLKQGRYDHEFRKDMEEKNLLFTGMVSVEEVIDMVLACGGDDYESSPHDMKVDLTVHVLKPRGKHVGWYVKFYYLDPNSIFISVHR